MVEPKSEPAGTDTPEAITQPQTSEDDYSGCDGGTPNAEAVAASQGDGPEHPAPPPDEQPAPPEETRSPTPPQPGG